MTSSNALKTPECKNHRETHVWTVMLATARVGFGSVDIQKEGKSNLVHICEPGLHNEIGGLAELKKKQTIFIEYNGF